ncbi:MAG: hypothetical protein ABW007_09945 [Chitinophagaceae bacterium]
MIPDIKNILLVCEIIAAVAGLIYYRKNPITLFSWFLVAVAIIELTGLYMRLKEWYGPLLKFYTMIAIPLQMIMLHGVFIIYFRSTKKKAVPWICLAVYLLSFAMEMLFLTGAKNVYLSASYSTGNICLLVLIMLYFQHIMKTPEIFNLRSSMMFYICTGLLLFYLGSFPFFALFNYLVENYTAFQKNYYWAMMTLSCLMYLTFTAGFIWSKPK